MKMIEKANGIFIKGDTRYALRPDKGQSRAEALAEAEAAGYVHDMLGIARTRKKQEIAAARYAAEFGGFTEPNSGLLVRTDERTRSLLTAARFRAQTNAAYLVENWKTADGSFITLNAPTIIALESAVHDFIEAQFAKEAELTAQINSAATTKEVNAIQW